MAPIGVRVIDYRKRRKEGGGLPGFKHLTEALRGVQLKDEEAVDPLIERKPDRACWN